MTVQPSYLVCSLLFQFHLEPGSEATFRLNISYPNKLGSYLGHVMVHTSFDRQLHIPVQYKTAMGTLHLIPDKITFEPTFPVREWRGVGLSRVREGCGLE